MTDCRMKTDSMRKYTDSPMWNAGLNQKMWELYLREGDHGVPQYAVPLLAHDFSNLPPAYSMIDQLAALDQAESHFRSENIKFGIRHRMRSGKTVLNHTQFLGYTKGPDGVLQIVPEEAEIVRKIFDLYIQGNGVRKIKRYLEEHGIKTVTGKSEWSTSTIDRMLSNEKYVGEVLM